MIILKAENISKQYRLGLIGTGTISHDLNRWWHRVRGKEDPYLKIGETNDRSSKGKSDYAWALKDINFEVKQGEVLGIIGKNGAGKSTLLKILSRVTSPTTGEIKTRGRIASLLEVGTGFHPELTGRENIYLNGAILGMTKAEIKAKEDEIIAFSGCERYVDTPVKRYSSGMRVRLAFAVAAFLEPDILVIDEVLAVGDAEFQKKAIGKMQDISKGDGRTVLFVSHDMDAILKLTDRVLLLENGKVVDDGLPNDIINKYTLISFKPKTSKTWGKGNEIGNSYAKLKSISVENSENSPQFEYDMTESINIKICYLDLNKEYKNTAIIHIIDEFDRTLFASNEFDSETWSSSHSIKDSLITTTCVIPGNLLLEGRYKVLIALGNYNPNMVHLKIDEALTFKVINKPNIIKYRVDTGTNWPGLIRPILDWKIETKTL
ncbi:ATP-binding cassette domain-containing protein [Formosa sediminum]|uniref:ATP-binding cassette domain-containing protein n=1 Tax=Formosa sediminum TaxID=2594004 RepID=A0A516GRP1_9FLAO|nr:ABC transporter ATP-binding protein [Formosa sediminum]QDO94173.1 ATP-binding cassette domain-containing protein [Formosa sediminum]